ncbi:hypothetical protein AMECASPLE_023371 [Ameca splendens]|uniref:Uncharacterized protein n=1 Tax=Ameca splendens TaxID=208324 RepID=A0ABV0YF59_9TELE
MLQLYNQAEYASVVTHGNPLHTDSAELGCDGGLRRCCGTHCTLYLGRTNKLQRKHFTRHITRVDKKKISRKKSNFLEFFSSFPGRCGNLYSKLCFGTKGTYTGIKHSVEVTSGVVLLYTF